MIHNFGNRYAVGGAPAALIGPSTNTFGIEFTSALNAHSPPFVHQGLTMFTTLKTEKRTPEARFSVTTLSIKPGDSGYKTFFIVQDPPVSSKTNWYPWCWYSRNATSF